jgi:hypothetical protein
MMIYISSDTQARNSYLDTEENHLKTNSRELVLCDRFDPGVSQPVYLLC